VRILICDDNVDSANTWAALLDSEGHDVRVSHYGKCCVEAALAWRPHAALVDIGLPELDGYAVARAIRASPSGATMLLIAVTGYSRPDDVARSKAAGFDHHFRKPADVDEVLRHLDELHRAGLLDDAELEAKRRQALGEHRPER
jgi:CheY-like chemotaxis protein